MVYVKYEIELIDAYPPFLLDQQISLARLIDTVSEQIPRQWCSTIDDITVNDAIDNDKLKEKFLSELNKLLGSEIPVIDFRNNQIVSTKIPEESKLIPHVIDELKKYISEGEKYGPVHDDDWIISNTEYNAPFVWYSGDYAYHWYDEDDGCHYERSIWYSVSGIHLKITKDISIYVDREEFCQLLKEHADESKLVRRLTRGLSEKDKQQMKEEIIELICREYFGSGYDEFSPVIDSTPDEYVILYGSASTGLNYYCWSCGPGGTCDDNRHIDNIIVNPTLESIKAFVIILASAEDKQIFRLPLPRVG